MGNDLRIMSAVILLLVFFAAGSLAAMNGTTTTTINSATVSSTSSTTVQPSSTSSIFAYSTSQTTSSVTSSVASSSSTSTIQYTSTSCELTTSSGSSRWYCYAAGQHATCGSSYCTCNVGTAANCTLSSSSTTLTTSTKTSSTTSVTPVASTNSTTSTKVSSSTTVSGTTAQRVSCYNITASAKGYWYCASQTQQPTCSVSYCACSSGTPTNCTQVTSSTITSATTTVQISPYGNQTCPLFYYFNRTVSACQPQLLSPACPPNYPNSPVYYFCSGTAVSPGVCPSGYYFSSNHCILVNATTSSTSTFVSTTFTIYKCPGGSFYNSTTKLCRCPVGAYYPLGGTGCVSGTPVCLGGSYYNSSYNGCACPASTYLNGTACSAPVSISFPPNVVYSANAPVIKNATPVSSLPPTVVNDLSSAIGVPISATANAIAGATNVSSVKIACFSCNATANVVQQNGIVEGFVVNGTLLSAFVGRAIANGTVGRGLANAIVQNATLFSRVVRNFTPRGFVAVPNASEIKSVNATGYLARWAARGNSSREAVNISTIKNLSYRMNLSAMPLPQKVSAPLIADSFANTSVVNRTVTHSLLVTQAANGNRTVTRYTPMNATTYASAHAAVVSVTNIESSVQSEASIREPGLVVKAVSFSTKSNVTASAVAVRVAENATSLTSRFLPQLPGRVFGYMKVNSTINESQISSVNYTFNVTALWLAQNKVNPLSLWLYRFNTTTQNWTRLRTILVSANATSYVYRAASPGASIYAIAFAPINITTANVAVTIEPLKQLFNITNSTPTTTLTPQQRATSALLNAVVLAMAVAIVVILMLLYFLLRPPMNRREEVTLGIGATDYNK